MTSNKPIKMVHLRVPKLASAAALSLLVLTASLNSGTDAFSPAATNVGVARQQQLATTKNTALFGKKKKGGTPGPNYKKGGGQPKQEKASVKEARFDAATRQFMFTLVGLSKTLPDKSKDILKNINLSFYHGAKIGVVGLNGSGKVSIAHSFSLIILSVVYLSHAV